jgi:hypothetical protein
MDVELWLLVCYPWSYTVALLRCRFSHGVAHGFLVPQYCSRCSDYRTGRAVRYSARTTASFLAPDCTQCLLWRHLGVSPDVVDPCAKLSPTCMKSMEVWSHTAVPPDGGIRDEAVATCNCTATVSTLHWMPGLRRSVRTSFSARRWCSSWNSVWCSVNRARYYSRCRRRA